MTKENKILSFVKEHRKSLLLTGGVIAGAVLLACSVKKDRKIRYLKKSLELAQYHPDIDIPDNIREYVSELWRDKGSTVINCILEPIPVGDMPNAISSIKDNLDFLNDGTPCFAVVSFDV